MQLMLDAYVYFLADLDDVKSIYVFLYLLFELALSQECEFLRCNCCPHIFGIFLYKNIIVFFFRDT
jgi:hypothetical protein